VARGRCLRHRTPRSFARDEEATQEWKEVREWIDPLLMTVQVRVGVETLFP